MIFNFFNKKEKESKRLVSHIGLMKEGDKHLSAIVESVNNDGTLNLIVKREKTNDLVKNVSVKNFYPAA